MKRQGYRFAIEWVAMNDNAGGDDARDAASLNGYLTVCLVADLFGKPQETVAADVVAFRKKHGVGSGE